MKKFLLFAAAVLMITSANAQHKAPVVQNRKTLAKEKLSQLPPMQKLDFNQYSSIREMTNADRSIKSLSNAKAPKKAGYLEPYYKRPAGMYVCPFFATGGSGLWSYGDLAFIMAKPFADYLFEGEINGEVDENTHMSWDVFIRDQTYYLDDVQSFLFSSYWWSDPTPVFYAVDSDLDDTNANWYDYQIKAYDTEETIGGGVKVNGETPAEILTVDNIETVALMFGEELEFMYSSKTMVAGGRNADQVGMLSRYYGADPVEGNEYGWWFGKNASHVDGMAMCFEEPQHPYLLTNVYLQAAPNSADAPDNMVVTAPVKMKCRVYKIDEIPDYQEVGGAYMPLEPGELIVTGEATVTPTTGEANNGLIKFTLYAQDDIDPSLTYEYHPTVDYPIMICIDGYNDPGMEDLVNFSAFVCTDDQVDEGYGELCYLKQGIYEYEIDENGDTVTDEDGNPVQFFTGEYRWRGLNNYFSGGTLTMKTGLSIFIGTENPYLTYVHGLEDGEYTFPDEGGFMTKTFEYSDGTVYTTESIDFLSSVPGEDGDMWMTWNGSEELPDWLEINLVDKYGEDGEFTGYVTAEVTATPLPEGTDYREAVIRFEISGDYKDYKFMQGVNNPGPEPVPGDVNGDGEVNIADVNCVISVIQGGEDIYEGRADVNKDGEVNIGDVNAIIAIILS
jgi:hypothetical protein